MSSKEIKQRVKENYVESIFFRDKVFSIKANYKITYRNDDQDSEYVLYEIYIAEKFFNKINLQFIFHKQIFKTRQTEDELESGGSITDLVFDAEHQDSQSWRVCNSRLPRSEVVYFTPSFIIIFLITVSRIKLVFFKLDCKESTFWFSLLSCRVWYALPNPKLRTKYFQPLT